MVIPKIIKSYNQNNHIISVIDENDILYDAIVFQSYRSTILYVDSTGFYFSDNIDDYTQTTCKYLVKCLRDIRRDVSAKNGAFIDSILESGNVKKSILKYIIETGQKINV